MHRALPPVCFLIGPGRSGTTLLYKLLCLHPDTAYISNIDQRCPWMPARLSASMRPRADADKLKHWFNAGGNAYLTSRTWRARLVATPVEGEAIYGRCGLPLVPQPSYRPDANVAERLRERFAKLMEATDAKVFVAKRTANNRRIPALDAVFPSARYVYLVRDGRDVAASLERVDWWNEHRLWWDPLRRTPMEAVAAGDTMLRLCAHNWVAETQQIELGLADVPAVRIMRMRYEELISSPVDCMNAVLDFLALDRRRDYDAAVAAVKLGDGSGGWRRVWSAQEIQMVQHEQQDCLKQLGYA